MKKFIAALFVAGFVLLAAPVNAGEVTLTWSNPTSEITLTEAGPYTNPGGTRVYQLVADIADPAETVTLPDMLPGTYTYVAVAYSDTGEASPVSNEAVKIVADFVTTNIVVKIVSKMPSGFLLLGVGTIPLGTPCNVAEEIKGHYVVSQDTIIWSDPARNDGTAPLPLLVVAQCG